ncbi:hypothetical protein [Tsukamurella paurometabola]|uniref:Uncharacterized protein n=1 Tax=Tsukamurella paurometabola TaxID=2061 RepID=A0ABS5NF92_TSUPA|nr:hypothetical protein [Tsukamurella paurometabola]MBS4102939.1 hypothetical protein [Tsukamurella paurometabola]
MNQIEIDRDIALYRYAAETLARGEDRPAAATAFLGAVAAAMRESVLDEASYVPYLVAHLRCDRLAEVAGDELGVLLCMTQQAWALEHWQKLETHVEETELPVPLTDAEERHRRAAIAAAADHPALRGHHERTAYVSLIGVLAAVRTRWELGGLNRIATSDQDAVIADVLAGDPVAQAAAEELGDGWRIAVEGYLAELWPEVVARAAEAETLAAIEAATA